MELDYSQAGFTEKQIFNTAVKLLPTINEMNSIVKTRNWASDYASLLLPSEKTFLHQSHRVLKQVKADNFIVVGIGGSNLGTLALQEPLGKKIFYADTTDPDHLKSIIKQCKGKTLVNIVSKSGSTTETIANACTLLKELKNYEVIVTTDSGSKLDKEAEQNGWLVLEVPSRVGGRYSVFSNVGLLPLAWSGLNTTKLLDGAELMIESCMSNDVEENPAAILASLIYLNYQKNRVVFDQFLFSNDLEALGKWYRQLLGESIGKHGIALTPTVSIGSTDLHSMGQSYLGGADNKFYRIVNSKFKNSAIVPKNNLAPNLNGKSFNKIMNSISTGFQTALANRKKPFVSFNIDKTEEELGGLMQLEMVEVMLLAKLLKVNAFDQPQVEEYKKHTRKLLK
ncbi:hypothetical protein HUU53_04185 [Candidatus Micrarchaeota archaeon]|nr:hypothetical protein [Candidatus Micrarchaeota archaeon]